MKQELYELGIVIADRFIAVNRLQPVTYRLSSRINSAGAYRNTRVTINLDNCRTPCPERGRAWSYPGYTADMTPYGVIAHEIGHHIWASRPAWHDGWEMVWKNTKPITSYGEGDPEESFCETVKLFITNPDLLKCIAPTRYAFLTKNMKPVTTDDWHTVLAGAPARVVNAARRKCGQCDTTKRSFRIVGHDGISHWTITQVGYKRPQDIDNLPNLNVVWWLARERPCLDGDDMYIAFDTTCFYVTFDGYCSRYDYPMDREYSREELFTMICTDGEALALLAH